MIFSSTPYDTKHIIIVFFLAACANLKATGHGDDIKATGILIAIKLTRFYFSYALDVLIN